MLYRISVTERGLTGIANIFRSRLSRLDDLLGAGTVPLTMVRRLIKEDQLGHFRRGSHRDTGRLAMVLVSIFAFLTKWNKNKPK